MVRKLDMLLISAKGRMDRFMEHLLHEEKGAADIVAILVVIVVVIAIAAVFKTQLTSMINDIFEAATQTLKGKLE